MYSSEISGQSLAIIEFVLKPENKMIIGTILCLSQVLTTFSYLISI